MLKNKLFIKMGGTMVGIDKIKPIHAHINKIMEQFYELIRILPDTKEVSNATKRSIKIPFTVYEAIKHTMERHVAIDPKKGAINRIGLYHSQVSVPIAYLAQANKFWTHLYKPTGALATNRTMKSEIGNGNLFMTYTGMLRPYSEFNSEYI